MEKLVIIGWRKLMIKLVIFDLDGVLVDARELHYEALNLALSSVDEKYVISRDEHLSTFDGTSTKKKLNMLTELKGLPKDSHDLVWRLKQDKTLEIIDKFDIDSRIKVILKKLKSDAPGRIIITAPKHPTKTAIHSYVFGDCRKKKNDPNRTIRGIN